MEIIPAILAKDERELEEKLAALPRDAVSAHVDFVFSTRFALCVSAQFLEAHLMVPHPQEYIADLVQVGYSRILIQVAEERHHMFEAHQHLAPLKTSVSPEVFAELIHEWRDRVEIGAVLEIETPLDAIDSFAHELKTIQLMGIAHIGKQGEPFDERVIARVRVLHTKYPHLTIAVDGGVNKKNAERLVAVGATRLVVGSALKEFYG